MRKCGKKRKKKEEKREGEGGVKEKSEGKREGRGGKLAMIWEEKGEENDEKGE